MAELKHISELLGISDEDAAEVIRDIAVSIGAHHLMSEVLGELGEKYGKKAILAGMMLAKTFEVNERAHDREHDFGSG